MKKNLVLLLILVLFISIISQENRDLNFNPGKLIILPSSPDFISINNGKNEFDIFEEFCESERLKNILYILSEEVSYEEERELYLLNNNYDEEEFTDITVEYFYKLINSGNIDYELRKLNNFVEINPEIIPLLKDITAELILSNKDRNTQKLVNNINQLKFDNSEYKERILSIKFLNKYIVKLFENQWNKANSEYNNTQDFKKYENKVESITKLYIFYFLRVKKYTDERAIPEYEKEWNTAYNYARRGYYKEAIPHFLNCRGMNYSFFVSKAGHSFLGVCYEKTSDIQKAIEYYDISLKLEAYVDALYSYNRIKYIYNSIIKENPEKRLEFIDLLKTYAYYGFTEDKIKLKYNSHVDYIEQRAYYVYYNIEEPETMETWYKVNFTEADIVFSTYRTLPELKDYDWANWFYDKKITSIVYLEKTYRNENKMDKAVHWKKIEIAEYQEILKNHSILNPDQFSDFYEKYQIQYKIVTIIINYWRNYKDILNNQVIDEFIQNSIKEYEIFKKNYYNLADEYNKTNILYRICYALLDAADMEFNNINETKAKYYGMLFLKEAEFFKKEFPTNANLKSIMYNAGGLYFILKDYENSLKTFTWLKNNTNSGTTQNIQSWFMILKNEYELKNYDSCIKNADEFLQLSIPAYYKGFGAVYKGRALTQKENYEEAKQMFEKAIKEYYDTAGGNIYHGELLLKQGNYEEAFQYYEKGLKYTGSEDYKIDGYIGLITCGEKTGEYSKAFEGYKKLLSNYYKTEYHLFDDKVNYGK
ncbi:MAG: tetratricopeptide repeat protein, partial [Candidatus Muiribacteriota bacterium]